MCGITGWFSSVPIPVEEASPRLHRMMEAIAHRGPDGKGDRIFGHAALGHVRLSIIDLRTGLQPMSSPGGETTISYNGEIYNYETLRRQLMDRGYPFRTHSDTEVILALYETEGWKGFEKLRGMYAFALWDEKRQTGWLVRDPLGIKPIFIAEGEGGECLFASEGKSLLAGGVPGRLNSPSLHLLMNFRYIPGEGSLFEGIHQLPPGGVLEWTSGGDIRRHRLELPSGKPGELSQAMRESVEAHLTADVEVGGYLSGGIDSAAVSLFAAKSVPHDYRTFTLDVGDDPEEARNARRTSEILGIQNFLHDSPQSPDSVIPELIHSLEIPKVNAWQISELARFASQHVKVALSGLGGDELFYGYNLHGIFAKAATLERMMPAPVSRWVGGGTASLIRSSSQICWTEPERAARMLSSLGDWPRVYGLIRNVWDQPVLREAIYGPRLLDSRLPDAFGWIEEHWPEDRDPVEAVARFEWEQKMVNDLLWQEDRCSMAHGLEVRVPFVDGPLASTVRQLSRHELMPRGQLKARMRSELASSLPEEILIRPKSGFQVSAGEFFESHLKSLADVWLSEAKVKETGLFNPAFVRQVRKAGPSLRLRWHFFILYLMLGAHLWIEIFENNHDPADLIP